MCTWWFRSENLKNKHTHCIKAALQWPFKEICSSWNEKYNKFDDAKPRIAKPQIWCWSNKPVNNRWRKLKNIIYVCDESFGDLFCIFFDKFYFSFTEWFGWLLTIVKTNICGCGIEWCGQNVRFFLYLFVCLLNLKYEADLINCLYFW